jgi:hypothetical protein
MCGEAVEVLQQKKCRLDAAAQATCLVYASPCPLQFKCFYFTHSSYVHFNVRLYSKGCDGGECVVEAQRRKVS